MSRHRCHRPTPTPTAPSRLALQPTVSLARTPFRTDVRATTVATPPPVQCSTRRHYGNQGEEETGAEEGAGEETAADTEA